MFKTVYWKEVHEHVTTFRFAAAMVTMTLLVLVSFMMLGSDYLNRLDSYNTLSETYRLQDEGFLVPSYAQPTVSTPPSPLEIFAVGEQRQFGNFITIERWEVPTGASETISHNELLETIPTVDLVTIFIFVGGLFSILFSYDAITADRSRGTLKLMLTGNLGRSTLYFAKFLGLLNVICLPALVSMLAGLLLLSFSLNIAFTASQWAAILIMIGAVILYLAIMTAAGMLFSCLVKSSAASAVLSFLFFVAAIYLVPIAGGQLAEMLYPVGDENVVRVFERESEKGVTEQCRAFSRSTRPETTEGVVWSDWNSRRGGPHTVVFDGNKELFIWLANLIQYAEPLWRERADAVWQAKERLFRDKRRQADFAKTVSRLSPSQQVRTVFTMLAGTDFEGYYRFVDEAQQYRRKFLGNLDGMGFFSDNATQFFSRRKLSEILSDTPEAFAARKREYRRRYEENRNWIDNEDSKSWDALLGKLPADIIPPFGFRRDHIELSAVLVPLITMCVMLLLMLAAGVIALQRYDVREGE